MKFGMKKALPITLGTLLLTSIMIFAISSVDANHVATVSITPSEIEAGSQHEFTVLVQNAVGGDNINYFEITLPMQGDSPYYLVKEASEPAGWDLNTIYKVGSSDPYKVTWSTSGIGIEQGKSLEFKFTANAPVDQGQFSWSWKSSDVNGGTRAGVFTTKSTSAPFSTLKLVVAKNVKAGKYYQITLTALNEDGTVKTDYTGTVSFESTDKMAVLPKTYTFQPLDQGIKQLTFKMKTAGEQSISVTTDDMIINSGVFNVNQGDVAATVITLDKNTVTSGSNVVMKVVSMDIYGNEVDVTSKSKFEIDREADGKFTYNTYTAGNVGTWTLNSLYYYNGLPFKSGLTLSIVEGEAVVEEPTTPVVPETPVVEEPTIPVVTEQTKGMTIITVESVAAKPGEIVSFNVSVKNTGTVDLTNVGLKASGIPDGWMTSIPTFVNIASGKTQNYVVAVNVPAGEAGVKIMTISASSMEGVSASKSVSLSVGEKSGMTGLFSAMFAKPLYVGLAIVILIILILIVWKLVPSTDSRKKSEE
jgi:uncharacterized protein YcnI